MLRAFLGAHYLHTSNVSELCVCLLVMLHVLVGASCLIVSKMGIANNH